MANLSDRAPENAPGRYFVDGSCIDCDQCRVIAPDLFDRNPDAGYGFVKRQPRTVEEQLLAEEALQACGVAAIGNNGV